MIAAALFPFGSCFALWTIYEVGAAFGVFEELLIMLFHSGLLLTRVSGVPLHAALEAHFKAARAHRRLASFLALRNVADAVWLRAPAQRRVQINDNVLMESQVLGVDILAAKLPNVFASVDFFAAKLHAGNFHNSAFRDFNL